MKQIQNKGNPVRGKRVLEHYCFNIIFKRLFLEKNISVLQFSLETGIKVSSIYEYLDGTTKKMDSPEKVIALAKYFGLNHRDELEFGTVAESNLQKELEQEREKNKKLEFEIALKQLDIESYIAKINDMTKAG